MKERARDPKNSTILEVEFLLPQTWTNQPHPSKWQRDPGFPVFSGLKIFFSRKKQDPRNGLNKNLHWPPAQVPWLRAVSIQEVSINSSTPRVWRWMRARAKSMKLGQPVMKMWISGSMSCWVGKNSDQGHKDVEQPGWFGMFKLPHHPPTPRIWRRLPIKLSLSFFRWGLVCSMKPIEPVLQNLRISFGPPRGMWSCWEDLPGQGERIKTAATKGYYSSLSLNKALQNPCFSGVIQLPNKWATARRKWFIAMHC